MWIVRLALSRPYSIVVLAILIVLLASVSIYQTPTDIFPEIDLPVVTVIWTYKGMAAEEIEKRIGVAQDEIKAAKLYNHTVINQNLDQAVLEVEEIISNVSKQRRKE